MNAVSNNTKTFGFIRLRDFEQRWNSKCFRTFKLDTARRKLIAETLKVRDENIETSLPLSCFGMSGLATVYKKNCFKSQFAAIYVRDDSIRLWFNNQEFEIDENSHALISLDGMLGNRFTLYSGVTIVDTTSFHTGLIDPYAFDDWDWDYEPSFWEYVAEVISDRRRRKTFAFIWSALAVGKQRPEAGFDFTSIERLQAVSNPFDTTCDVAEFETATRAQYDQSAPEDLSDYVREDVENFWTKLRPSSIAIILILISIFLGIAADAITSRTAASSQSIAARPRTARDTSPQPAPTRAKALQAVSTLNGLSTGAN